MWPFWKHFKTCCLTASSLTSPDLHVVAARSSHSMFIPSQGKLLHVRACAGVQQVKKLHDAIFRVLGGKGFPEPWTSFLIRCRFPASNTKRTNLMILQRMSVISNITEVLLRAQGLRVSRESDFNLWRQPAAAHPAGQYLYSWQIKGKTIRDVSWGGGLVTVKAAASDSHCFHTWNDSVTLLLYVWHRSVVLLVSTLL